MVVGGRSASLGNPSAAGIEVIVVQRSAVFVGEHGGGIEVVGDVILDVRGIRRGLRDVARQPLSREENVIRDVAAGIGFGQAEPIVGYRRAACFLDALPASIICVCGGHSIIGAGDDPIIVVVDTRVASAVVGHISRRFILWSAPSVLLA